MCGIIGIYNSHHKIPLALLENARDALEHRGPDEAGSWLSHTHHVGLAHRRLSIRDVKEGTQPLSNAAKTIYAVVNGEFYNYSEHRQNLEKKGYRFLTQSDSELVIHLYEAYDLEFVHYLRGEFAFILYDQTKNKLIAIRDRFGIKPLCYYFKNGIFYLASEAKALFKLGLVPAWNEDALYHAFCFQYLPKDQTLFKDIYQVLPGHMMIYDGNTLYNKAYWHLNYPTLDNIEEMPPIEHLSQALDSKLREVISLRLETQGLPVCCHLSGGVDSATIAALGSELHGTPLPCFTIVFPHAAYNEFHYAKGLAEKIHAPFYPLFVGAEEMIAVLSDAVYYSEGLAINNHLSAKYILNREIKKMGFKIVLTGEGSDELFAGYGHLQQDYFKRSLLKENIASGIHLSNGPTLPLDTIQKQLGFIPSFIKAKAAIGYQLHNLLDPRSRCSSKVIQSILDPIEVTRYLANRHPVNQSTYLWIKFSLSGYILKVLGDGCEMAHGIEGRVPFLDHELFAFAKQIPLSMKITAHHDKFILRKTVRKYVTPDIFNSMKQPFLAPPFSILSNKKGYEFMQEILQQCDQVPFVNKKKVQHYLNSIPKKSILEQQSAEPVLMLLLTSVLLSQRYSL